MRMHDKIRRYREILNWFTQHSFIEEKSINHINESGILVEAPSYVRATDTDLPYYKGTTIDIRV